MAKEYGIENYESCMYDDVKGWETDRKAREQWFKDGAEYGYNKANEWHFVKEENEILKSVIKVLISTLDDTLWDEGHPGYSDSEPGYKCPACACKNCYRVSCEYNESELFKQLNTDFPELFKKESE